MDNNNLQDDCQTVRVGRIYFIRCLITNMYYVGQTVRKLNERIGQHRRCKTSEIGKAIHKYGRKNFTHGIPEDNVAVELLNEREKYWITFFDCVVPKGYNRTCDGQVHVVYSNAAREKMRKSHIGEKNPMYKKNLTEELRKKLFESHRERSEIMLNKTKEQIIIREYKFYYCERWRIKSIR